MVVCSRKIVWEWEVGKTQGYIRVRNNNHLLTMRNKYQQIKGNKSESSENNIILKREKNREFCLFFRVLFFFLGLAVYADTQMLTASMLKKG